MSHSSVGERMTAEQPRLTAEEAGALARDHFGLTGTLAPLTSERDQNFRLTTAEGLTYVLKIANAAEPAEVTNFIRPMATSSSGTSATRHGCARSCPPWAILPSAPSARSHSTGSTRR